MGEETHTREGRHCMNKTQLGLVVGLALVTGLIGGLLGSLFLPRWIPLPLLRAKKVQVKTLEVVSHGQPLTTLNRACRSILWTFAPPGINFL